MIVLEKEERIENDVWNRNNTDGQSIVANLLFDYLVSEGDLDPEEDSVYDLEPIDLFYGMYQFHVPQLGAYYAIDDFDETEDAVKKYLREYFEEEENLENLPEHVIENNLDERYLTRMIQELYEDWIYNDPENYVDEKHRDLSDKQEQMISVLKKQIDSVENEILKLANIEIEDENQQKKMDNYLEKLFSFVDGFKEEIEEIQNNPEGEWFDWAIEEAIERNVAEYENELYQFVVDHEVPLDHAIDMNSLIDYVYDSDGFGVLPTYDGNFEEVRHDGETYVILRIS